jgi:2-(1,2-epoxy-1,2-dihydrophenyl)acetyl-CoA isomerase
MSLVLLDVADGAATITLNSPRNGNAIDLELAKELAAVLHRCESIANLRAIVVRGDGRVFCVGGDLVAIRDRRAGAAAYVRELLGHLHEAISTMARIPVPVLASVQGAAAGAGLALACACDLAIAAQSCRFVMAYTRVGLTPDGSSSWYLPRLIGARRALELSLLNRTLSAPEALQWGLVNEVVPDDALQSRTTQLVTELASGPGPAFAETKRLMRTSLQDDLETQMNKECDAICRALETREAAIGLDAFLAKRVPTFRD